MELWRAIENYNTTVGESDLLLFSASGQDLRTFSAGFAYGIDEGKRQAIEEMRDKRTPRQKIKDWFANIKLVD